MLRSLWFSDFEFRRDHLRVRKTGAIVPYTGAVIGEVWDWLQLYCAVQLMRVWNALRGRTGPRMAFPLDEPRPWYLFWAVAKVAGARFVSQAQPADLYVYFDDATRSAGAVAHTNQTTHGARAAGARTINAACTDVSKSHVARVFETVFGYPLAVDPMTWTGPAVEKSEENGAHDGRLVQCPCAPRSGYVYQRVIETTGDDGLVTDLRCPTIAGEIPLVFIKRRPLASRFANANACVDIVDPDSVLSADERATLRRFAEAMNLDWGGLDVLRDRVDGRVYVVDVNKTDMGPPTALPLRGQIRAVTRMAARLRSAFGGV